MATEYQISNKSAFSVAVSKRNVNLEFCYYFRTEDYLVLEL